MVRQIQQAPFEICIQSVNHPGNGLVKWKCGRQEGRPTRRYRWLIPLILLVFASWGLLGLYGLGPGDLITPLSDGNRGELQSLATPEGIHTVDAGLTLLDIQTHEAALIYHVPTVGVYVLSVSDGSPAKLAGIEPGDRIIELNGAPVLDAQSVLSDLNSLSAGKKSTLMIRRGHERITVTLDAGAGDEQL